MTFTVKAKDYYEHILLNMIISQLDFDTRNVPSIIKISAEQFAQIFNIQSYQEAFKLLQITTNRLLTRTAKFSINKDVLRKINLTDYVLFNLKEKSVEIVVSGTIKSYVNSLDQDPYLQNRTWKPKSGNCCSKQKYSWFSKLITKLRLIFARV